MKRYISAIAVFALLAGTGIAQAHDNRGRDSDDFKLRMEDREKSDDHKMFGFFNEDRDDKFVVLGTVTAKTDSSLTLAVQADNRTEIEGSVIVSINADTKYKSGKDSATLADVIVGNRIAVSGELENSVYTVAIVQLMPRHQPKVMGTVTAITDTSVTVKNNVTGEEKVVALEADTKVVVNGESATTADIQVGDKGWIKLKSNLTNAVAKIISLFR